MMNPLKLFSHICVFVVVAILSGCATQGKPPPTIALDEPVQASPLPELPKPVEVVEVPKVLPMPAQMKPLADAETKAPPESPDEKQRVSRANCHDPVGSPWMMEDTADVRASTGRGRSIL